MTVERAEVDFLIGNHGSMSSISAMSENANEAVKAGLIGFEEWQVMGGSIMVDQRMVGNLIAELQEDGFAIAFE